MGHGQGWRVEEQRGGVPIVAIIQGGVATLSASGWFGVAQRAEGSGALSYRGPRAEGGGVLRYRGWRGRDQIAPTGCRVEIATVSVLRYRG